MPETTHVTSLNMAYPAEVTADDYGTVTSLKFFCAAHGEDVPCVDCDNAEAAAFQTAEHYTAYVRGNAITTFGGLQLAHVKRLFLGRRRYTPTGGSYRMAYVQAISHGGTVRWHGRFNHDGGNLITLHRSKG